MRIAVVITLFTFAALSQHPAMAAPSPAPSAFFDPETAAQLLASYTAGQDALRTPPPAPEPVPEVTFEPPPPPAQKLKVKALIYVDNGAWATWINDSKATPDNRALDGMDIAAVTPDAVTLTRKDVGKTVRLNAAVAQTADPGDSTVADVVLSDRSYLDARPASGGGVME